MGGKGIRKKQEKGEKKKKKSVALRLRELGCVAGAEKEREF